MTITRSSAPWIIASWDLLKGLVPLNNLLTGVGEKLGVDTSVA